MIATMTRQGINAAEAVTSLASMLRGFLKPANQSIAAAAQLGIKMDVASLASKGLLGWLRQIEGIDPQMLAKLFPETEALKGVAALLKDLSGASADLAANMASAGAAFENFDKAMSTAQKRKAQYQQIVEGVKQDYSPFSGENWLRAAHWATSRATGQPTMDEAQAAERRMERQRQQQARLAQQAEQHAKAVTRRARAKGATESFQELITSGPGSLMRRGWDKYATVEPGEQQGFAAWAKRMEDMYSDMPGGFRKNLLKQDVSKIGYAPLQQLHDYFSNQGAEASALGWLPSPDKAKKQVDRLTKEYERDLARKREVAGKEYERQLKEEEQRKKRRERLARQMTQTIVSELERENEARKRAMDIAGSLYGRLTLSRGRIGGGKTGRTLSRESLWNALGTGRSRTILTPEQIQSTARKRVEASLSSPGDGRDGKLLAGIQASTERTAVAMEGLARKLEPQ